MNAVRADKWLWAARLWKTRSQAATALKGGAVKVRDERADPATLIRVGDLVEARAPSGRKVLLVLELSEVRGPPEAARRLFEDRSPPEPVDVPVALRDRGAGRPTKRERRDILRLREE